MSQTQFQATDRIEVSDHARVRWHERASESGEPEYPPEVAWRRSRDRAIPWGAHNAMFVRYDSQTDCLLIAKRQCSPSGTSLVLLTVERAEWNLDRSEVRAAVRDALEEDGVPGGGDREGPREVLG